MAINFRAIHVLVVLTVTVDGLWAQNSRKELRIKDINREKIIQLGQSVNIDPSKAIQLSWQPRLFLYRGFLSEDECDYLISQVHSKVSLNFQGDRQNMDETFRRIEERIYAWTFLPKENSQTLQISHFGSEDLKQNYSYFGNKSSDQVRESLLATVILYLSNVSEGGELLFPRSKSQIRSDCAEADNVLRPVKGNAVLFFNRHLNAAPDNSSFHSRCPVSRGYNLWYATKLFYLNNYESMKEKSSLSDNDGGGDCTDEDENCPRWAAIGECQRNFVFMIGSHDYYGTCRKSCNACS